MINAGGKETRLMDDQWTVRTADGGAPRPTSSTPSA